MQSPCDAPKFHEQDWSHFDFSRWHLDGVQLDATAAAIADLSQKLFNSEEWRRQFQGTVPDLQHKVLSFYEQNLRQLGDHRAAVAKDFEERIEAAESGRSRSVGSVNAPVPLVVEPAQDTFVLAVKVTGRDPHLGLPAIVVRLMDPRTPESALAESVTDRDGNVILSISPDLAKQVDIVHSDVEVATIPGKVLQKLSGAACIRLNQTETKVISLQDSADIQPNKDAALEFKSEREARAQSIAGKVDHLKLEREARLRDLDCRLQQIQEIITEIGKET
jgi:hypothetical protein